MLGWFSNVLRMERIKSESISFRKQRYFLWMLSSETILEKKVFQRLFCEKRYYCFPEGFVICNFFYIQTTVIWFFCSSQHFFTKISLKFKFFWLISVLSFKNLFLNPYLFIIALWSSLVIKGASLVRTYFLNWCIFIEYSKNTFFKSSQISLIKVALQYFRSKLIVVKVFVIKIFNNFRHSF